ncbi:hypothetical protein AVEN_215614-1 [Araneus ventricosus]|uniref:Uncharacterized protein n=1 Tax=Araneus ventricosus TaxID=182803 RepID=A0A4Y2VGG4_ARAVE|nr:hypothetical protein AVEN_141790-1 [Araneus ventricosus]GBO24386.1 hypothetical protein AVEN_215614-1 [Araneus ventricosus]
MESSKRKSKSIANKVKVFNVVTKAENSSMISTDLDTLEDQIPRVWDLPFSAQKLNFKTRATQTGLFSYPGSVRSVSPFDRGTLMAFLDRKKGSDSRTSVVSNISLYARK